MVGNYHLETSLNFTELYKYGVTHSQLWFSLLNDLIIKDVLSHSIMDAYYPRPHRVNAAHKEVMWDAGGCWQVERHYGGSLGDGYQ